LLQALGDEENESASADRREAEGDKQSAVSKQLADRKGALRNASETTPITKSITTPRKKLRPGAYRMRLWEISAFLRNMSEDPRSNAQAEKRHPEDRGDDG